jgi:membrane protease YdiL (CAAX protease family)
MRQYLKSLSSRSEFAIVVLGAFGPFIVSSLLIAAHPGGSPPISNAHLLSLLIHEPIILIALCCFLHVRGWTVQRVGLAFGSGLRDGLAGLLLAIAAYAAYLAAWIIAAEAAPEFVRHAGNSQLVTPNLYLGIVIAASLVNPVFEELFVSGYIISALKTSTSAWTAVNVSVAVRLLYHLYQGSFGVLSVVPIGLIFAWWYARTGRLWAVIVAHAMFDFFSLVAYAG